MKKISLVKRSDRTTRMMTRDHKMHLLNSRRKPTSTSIEQSISPSIIRGQNIRSITGQAKIPM